MNPFNDATVTTSLSFAFPLVLFYLMKMYSPVVNLHIQFTIIYLHKFYNFIENRSWLIAKEEQKPENKPSCVLNPAI